MFKHHHEHHHYNDPQGEARLRAVEDKLDLIIISLENIMATMEDLNAAVARETDAEDAVVTLLKGISQQLKDAKAANDPAAIDAVIAKLDANTAKLGASVVENTPSSSLGSASA